MFSFGISRHLIQFTKINVLNISRDPKTADTRMKYTVCISKNLQASVNFPEGESPLCAGVTTRSISKPQGGIP
jgi:hypothetical protein